MMIWDGIGMMLKTEKVRIEMYGTYDIPYHIHEHIDNKYKQFMKATNIAINRYISTK
jgi:hypothetical protein